MAPQEAPPIPRHLWLLGGTLLLAMFNTCQADRLQRQNFELLDELEEFQEELNQNLRRSGGRRRRSQRTGSRATENDCQGPTDRVRIEGAPCEAVWAALDDGDNILSEETFDWFPAGSESGGDLQLRLGSDLKSLNLLIENGADVHRLARWNNLPLAYRSADDPDVWVPALAEKVTRSEDGLTFRIRLREGVLWHEPRVDLNDERYAWMRGEHEVTADDVAFWMEMVSNPQVEGAAPHRSSWDQLEGWEVIDRYTIEVRWSELLYTAVDETLAGLRPYPRWLFAFDEDGQPIPEETLGLRQGDHWYNNLGMGCGPYRVAEWRSGELLVLERNDDFYRQPAGPFERVNFRILKDPEQWDLNLRNGSLDLTGLQPSQYIKSIRDAEDGPYIDGTLEHGTYDPGIYYYIGWNGDGALFSDRRVRLAMSHAFNAPLFLSEVFADLGVLTSGNFLPTRASYDPGISQPAFDLDAASALLAEAGWTDADGNGVLERTIDGEEVEFRFTLLVYGSSEEYRTLGLLYKEDLRRIGVMMDVTPLDWPSMQKRMNDRDFDAYTGAWVMGASPDDPYQLFHSSQADLPRASNRVGFRNQEADQIIEQGRQTVDADERNAMYRRFHQIMRDEQPYTFFYARHYPAAWQRNLTNVRFIRGFPAVDFLAWSFTEAEQG